MKLPTATILRAMSTTVVHAGRWAGIRTPIPRRWCEQIPDLAAGCLSLLRLRAALDMAADPDHHPRDLEEALFDMPEEDRRRVQKASGSAEVVTGLHQEVEGWQKLVEEQAERLELLERYHQAALNLLAVVHGDGGHHVQEVGFLRACANAEAVFVARRAGVSVEEVGDGDGGELF